MGSISVNSPVLNGQRRPPTMRTKDLTSSGNLDHVPLYNFLRPEVDAIRAFLKCASSN